MICACKETDHIILLTRSSICLLRRSIGIRPYLKDSLISIQPELVSFIFARHSYIINFIEALRNMATVTEKREALKKTIQMHLVNGQEAKARSIIDKLLEQGHTTHVLWALERVEH